MAQRIVIAPNDTNLRFEYVEGDDNVVVTAKGSDFPVHLILVATDSKFRDINTIVNGYLYHTPQKETVNA